MSFTGKTSTVAKVSFTNGRKLTIPKVSFTNGTKSELNAMYVLENISGNMSYPGKRASVKSIGPSVAYLVLKSMVLIVIWRPSRQIKANLLPLGPEI